MMRKIVGATTRRGVRLGLVPLLLLATACGKGNGGEDASAASLAGSWNPAGLTAVAGTPAAPVRAAIQQRVGATRPAPLDEDQWGHAKRLYARYGQGPLWFDQQGLIPDRTAALMKALINSHQDALRVDRYPVGDLARALGAVKGVKAPTPQQIAEADVLLTASYVALGEDLLTGQVDPKTVSKDWHIDPQEEQVDSALTRALREAPLDASLARMRPQDEDYAALRRELLRYRGIAARGEWPRVPAGKALKPGQSDSPVRLAALRQRLRMEGILNDSTAAGGGVYDSPLAGAVAEFQTRHGIESDSLLGAGTVASLNTPPGFRLGQIAANLERYRWLPRSFGSRYILVNVPAFRLEAFEQGKKALEMKVIVGEEFEGKVTPVFSDSMEYAVFRPYWLVTDDIAEKEIFPKMNADPGYLAAGNYELYQEAGKTRVRQKPGGKNSLGLVKFIFPNDYNIYLHDTPNGELFKEDVRAFSHGCIRVERPDQLAQWVFGWPEQKVREAMNGADDHRVSLPRKIPVYIAYFTTYMRDGKLHYGNDLYKRDDELIHAVAAGALPDPQSLKNLESLRRFVAN